MADGPSATAATDSEAVEEPPERADAASARRGWPRALVIVLRVAGGILLTLLLAWAILFITKGRFLKGPFEWITSKASGRTVKVAGDFQFYFNPINLKYLSEGLTVSNPRWAGTGNFAEVGRIEAQVATVTFVFGRRRVNILALRDARLDLQWDKARRRNSWTFSEEKGEPLDLPLIRRAIVAGTQVRYRDPLMRISAAIAIDTVEASDTRFENAIRFSGNGTARETPFTISGALLTPNATVRGGMNRLALHVRAARTRADITGTLPEATQIEGAPLAIDVQGANLADAFSVAGIAVPDTRRYRIRAIMTKQGADWRFTGLRGRFGDSDLAGRLTVTTGGPRLMLAADLQTQTLDIVDAGPFIGYSPDASASGKLTRIVAGSPRILPDAPLRTEALGNFDAKVDWTVKAVRAKQLPISNVKLGLLLDDRLLKLSPLNFSMARGTITSDIVIDARNPAVVTDYDVRLSPTPMGVLLKGFGVEESGTSGTLSARAKMRGTGDSVRKSLGTSTGRIAVILPRGTFWTRNVQLAELDIGTFIQKMFEGRLKEPVQINCGLIAFTVRNGIAAADPILIDTQKNVMLGRGGFSFRNETLDLAFRADSKKFSLFSGQSPVGIQGTFAQPKIDVLTPELLSRAGVGLGLGAAGGPLTALFAFVDVGDAKAAACGPVLAGATAQAQRDTKGRPRDDVGKGTTAKSEDGKRSPQAQEKQRKKFLGIF